MYLYQQKHGLEMGMMLGNLGPIKQKWITSEGAERDDQLAKRGCGLTIIVKNTVKWCDLDKGNKIIFEFVIWEVWSRGNDKQLIIVGIYHPPPSENNMHTTHTLINAFLKFYMELAVKFKNIMFLDFNMHANNLDNKDAIQFIEICDAVGVKKSV